MSNKTENLKEKYKGLLPINNRDYKDAKKYYEKYLKLFDGIVNCKDEESLKLWKKVICKNNPWGKALKSSNEFRSIADSDFKILKPLIEEEID